MVCDMRVYGHVLGIVVVGHDVVVYIMYKYCVQLCCGDVHCICVVYNIIFLYVIRLCTTRLCAMFF